MTTEEAKPIKIDKWDTTALKNTLDDAAKKVLVKDLGYIETHYLMDGRLVICTIGVLFALFALLWDYLHPFPLSRPVLITCVLSYFTLMGVLTAYTLYCEKCIYAVLYEKDRSGLDPDSTWSLSSRLKRYDDKYTMTLTYLDGKTNISRERSVTKSVGSYFDENGQLCNLIYESEVIKLHSALKVTNKSK